MGIATFLVARPAERLRGLQFLAFSETATILRSTAASDSGGGADWTWNTVGTAVPCRIYPVTPRGRAAIVGGALDERTTHFCALPVGTDVTASDRIVVAGRGTFDVTMAATRTDQLTRLVEVMES